MKTIKRYLLTAVAMAGFLLMGSDSRAWWPWNVVVGVILFAGPAAAALWEANREDIRGRVSDECGQNVL